MGVLRQKVLDAYKEVGSRVIEVPEWDMQLHIFPMTLAQLSAIESKTDVIDKALEILKQRACDENGNKLFDDADIAALRNFGVGEYGLEFINKISEQMNSDLIVDEDAAKK
jgi:hypothetical protein